MTAVAADSAHPTYFFFPFLPARIDGQVSIASFREQQALSYAMKRPHLRCPLHVSRPFKFILSIFAAFLILPNAIYQVIDSCSIMRFSTIIGRRCFDCHTDVHCPLLEFKSSRFTIHVVTMQLRLVIAFLVAAFASTAMAAPESVESLLVKRCCVVRSPSPSVSRDNRLLSHPCPCILDGIWFIRNDIDDDSVL